jgi:hypothetical protein
MKYGFAFLMMIGLTTPAAAGEKIVVELFTSQGCNSCPPADAYLGELAKRPDVLALSLHVDYWDYIGWKDPFAQAAFTARQREYQRVLTQRYIYTPQMVVDGHLQGVGSERSTIDGLIGKAAKQRAAAKRPSLTRDGDGVLIEGGQLTPGSMASVWLAVYEPAHRTPVRRGENAGRTLPNYNVVREWRVLGRYEGRPIRVPIEAPSSSAGRAIVVQEQATSGPGPILAALVLDEAR